jgi:hypothetical protein
MALILQARAARAARLGSHTSLAVSAKKWAVVEQLCQPEPDDPCQFADATIDALAQVVALMSDNAQPEPLSSSSKGVLFSFKFRRSTATKPDDKRKIRLLS